MCMSGCVCVRAIEYIYVVERVVKGGVAECVYVSLMASLCV